MILHDGRHPSNRNCHPLSLYFFCSCFVFGQEFGHFFFRKTRPVKFSDSFSRSTKKLAGYEELAGAFEPIRKRRYKILEVKKTYCREEAMDQFGKLQAPPSSRTLIRNEPFSTGHDKCLPWWARFTAPRKYGLPLFRIYGLDAHIDLNPVFTLD